MLKYEMYLVGAKIRAYDFEPAGDYRDGLYVEGTVVRHETREGARFLVINTEADTMPLARKTRPTRVGHETYVPMEMAFMEWDGRVCEIHETVYITVENEYGEEITKKMVG